jgi:hypothetical protein
MGRPAVSQVWNGRRGLAVQISKLSYCTVLVDNGAPDSSGVETGFPGG